MSYYDRFYDGYLITTDRETAKAVHGHVTWVAEAKGTSGFVMSGDEFADAWAPKKAIKGERYGKLTIKSWFEDALRDNVQQWHVDHPEDAAKYHERYGHRCERCYKDGCQFRRSDELIAQDEINAAEATRKTKEAEACAATQTGGREQCKSCNSLSLFAYCRYEHKRQL